MTPKYFYDKVKQLTTRLANAETRLPAGKIKVKFNPTNTIAAGAIAEISVTVPGAALGDAIAVAYPSDAGDPINAFGVVDNTNAVLVWVQNLRASGSITLAGDWFVHVIK